MRCTSSMEGLLYQLPLPWLIGTFAAVSAAAVFFAFKQFFNDPNKKAQEDKILLRELLEGFGLEVPAELKEIDGKVIESMKSS